MLRAHFLGLVSMVWIGCSATSPTVPVETHEFDHLPPCEARTVSGDDRETVAVLTASRYAVADFPRIALLDRRPYVMPYDGFEGLSCNHRITRIEPGPHSIHVEWASGGHGRSLATELEFDARPGHAYELVIEKTRGMAAAHLLHTCRILDRPARHRRRRERRPQRRGGVDVVSVGGSFGLKGGLLWRLIRVQMSRRILLSMTFGLLLLTGCVQGARWSVSDEPTPAEATILLEPRGSSSLVRALLGESADVIPIRKRLRACCAFGSGLGFKLGPLPVPGYQIQNILGPDDVGRHTYDSGMLRLRREGRIEIKLNEERNGLVYTCRGGFLDIAHVRDNADWMLYVAVQIYAHLLDSVEHPILLPRQGGRPVIRLQPVEEHLVERVGPRRLAIWLARWVVFNMSVWHEIATWFGWSSVRGIPETASAFSPEDLYSNLIGINVAEGVLYRRSARTEDLFNRGVDAWLEAVLAALGALPREAGLEATRAVEGLWWDPEARVPDKGLVLRRNMDVGDLITPWLVPDDRVSFELDAAIRRTCRNDRTPLRLVNHAERDGVAYRDWVQLEIEVDDGLAQQEPFTTLGRVVTEEDFPAIIEVIREQNRREFGPDADRPE